MVTDPPGGAEFYAEVTDDARIGAASAFTKHVVLPQFGKVMGAACAYADLGSRVECFLDAVAASSPTGRRVPIAYESDRDWALLESAIRDFDAKRWRDLRVHLKPMNVYNMPGFAAGERAATAYFGTQALALLSRHHALCDARALRISWSAAAAWSRDPSTLEKITGRAERHPAVSSRSDADLGEARQR